MRPDIEAGPIGPEMQRIERPACGLAGRRLFGASDDGLAGKGDSQHGCQPD